jgi:hypothetical protein
MPCLKVSLESEAPIMVYLYGYSIGQAGHAMLKLRDE